MKKLLCLVAALLSSSLSYAGLITHSDYTAGSVITAAGQNSNENTIVNEFNGNINSANIASGGVTSTNILDGTILLGDLNSSLQSTFTFVNATGSYRRPNLVWNSVSNVDIENNTGTANQTCVFFPNEQRCVTEDVASTSQFRRMIITEVAALSGTWNSGLRSGYLLTANTVYAIYAIKTTDNSSNYVMVADTITATQSNYATLNTAYGTNGWVYLGYVFYGDKSAATTSIKKFRQAGPMMRLDLTSTTGAVSTVTGIRLATDTNVAASTWTYSAGFALPSLPSTIASVNIMGSCDGAGSIFQMLDANNQFFIAAQNMNSAAAFIRTTTETTTGVLAKVNTGSGRTFEIDLISYYDSILANGYNPQL